MVYLFTKHNFFQFHETQFTSTNQKVHQYRGMINQDSKIHRSKRIYKSMSPRQQRVAPHFKILTSRPMKKTIHYKTKPKFFYFIFLNQENPSCWFITNVGYLYIITWGLINNYG